MSYDQKQMGYACRNGRVGEVEKLLKEAPSLLNTSLDSYGNTPLHKASFEGRTEVVKVLLASNADPNIQDKYGNTPLHKASYKGHMEVVKMLLASNADPNIKDKNGFKPGYKFNLDCVNAATKQEIHELLNEQRRRRKKRRIEAQQQLSTTTSNSSTSSSTPLSSLVSQTQEAERIGAIKCQFREDATSSPSLFELSAPEDMAFENSKKPPPAHCFQNAPELNFEDSPKALLPGPKELPPSRNDLEIANDDLLEKMEYACKNGRVWDVQQLLKEAPSLLNASFNEHGQTPLYCASFNGGTEVVKVLLASNADTNLQNTYGSTPLSVASLQGHIGVVKLLVASNADINIKNKDGNTPLHQASYKGNTEVVKVLLASNANSNIQDTEGATPLHKASYNGHTETVGVLLASNADINKQDKYGSTPLYQASYKGHTEVVKVLLTSNADINLKNKYKSRDGRKPGEFFSSDVKAATKQKIQQLLNEVERKKRTEAQQQKSTTLSTSSSISFPSSAASSSLSSSPSSLPELSAPEDMAFENSKKPPPAHCFQNAPELNFEDSLKALLPGPKELPPSRNDLEIANDDLLEKMGCACRNGRVWDVQQLLKEAPSLLNASLNEHGQTPLHKASYKGITEVVKVLLASNADINKQDTYGNTPLYQASSKGHTEVVKVLLASNADINKQDKEGSTPLHKASYSGHIDTVGVLLAFNADINKQDKYGSTPLYQASYMGHTEVVKVLLAFNADINLKKKRCIQPQDNKPGSGRKPGEFFSSDVKAATKQKIQQLLNEVERKKRTEAQQQNSTTLSTSSSISFPSSAASSSLSQKMEDACKHGRVEEVQQLLKEAPSLLNNASFNEHGWTPLHVASCYGKTEIVKLLLASNVGPNIKDKCGWTPLHVASRYGKIEIVELLLASNADPNIKDQFGWTPLHLPAFQGYTNIVKLLLASNADPNIKDKNGFKPGYKFNSDCVKAATKQEIQQLLNEERLKRIIEAQQQISTTTSNSSTSSSTPSSSTASSSLVSETQEEERIGAIKCKFGEDAVRFSLKKTTTFEELNAMVEGEWGEGKGLKFQDNDGDWLKMRSNHDVVEVWDQTKTGVVTLKAFTQQNLSPSPSSLPELSAPEDMAFENSKKPPLARCFQNAPELNFEDSLRALLLGPKELPPGRNDLEIANNDLFESLLYCCEGVYEQKMLEHPDLVGLLEKDQALAIIAYTFEYPYKVYFWLNAWLMQDRRDQGVINNVGPFFRLFYQGLEKLPRTTLKAGRAVKVKNTPRFRKLFRNPPNKGEKYTFWGVPSFSVKDGIVGEFSGKGEEEAILFSCGDLECVSIEKLSAEEREAEVLPLPPAIFKVSTTVTVNETKLVIALDHQPKDHVHCSYLRPASPKK